MTDRPLEDALRTERDRQRLLEERRSRQLREQFERAKVEAEETAERLAGTVSEHEVELRRRAAELEELRSEQALEGERAQHRQRSLEERLAASEARAAGADGEAARFVGELHRIRTSRTWRLAELLSGVKNSRGRPARLRRAVDRWRVGSGEPAQWAPAPPVLPVAAVERPGSEDPRRATISVIVTARSCDEALGDAIAGLESQTQGGLEIVLCDRGLEEGELASVLERVRGFDRVMVLRGDDDGTLDDARRMAGGRYRCELDPPMRLHPTFLEKAVTLLDAHPEVGFAYAWVETLSGEVWRARDRIAADTSGQVPPTAALIRHRDAPSSSTGRVIAEPLVRELASDRPSVVTPRKAAVMMPRRPVRPSGHRPLVLTLPWFTLGGGDRVVEALLQHWRAQRRDVFAVTTVDLGSGMVDRFGELLDLTPFAYHLPRLLPPEAWARFVGDVIASLAEPALLNIGNPWIYGVLPDLRSRFPRLRVVDQQFNDIGHLPANRQARGSIDVTVAAYTQLAETIRSDGRRPEAVETVPVGIPPMRPAKDCEVKAFRQTLAIPDHHRVISFVGRLSPEKRPEWALALAADLADDDVSLLLIGDGPLSAVLRGGIDSVPGLIWRRSVEHVEPLLAVTDVMIVPSRIEGIPLVAMEALTLGVPVVATRVGGLPEIEADPLVRLCDPDDYPGFVGAVQEVLGWASGDRVHRPDAFSLQVMLDRYDRLIEAAEA